MTAKAEKKQRLCFGILVLALLAYVIKNIFVGADIDEGYAIEVGYRLVTGDKLLLEMWEPHQTSGIFTALFMRPFLWLSGDRVDYLNIYLRVVYFVLHGSMALFVYDTFRRCKPDIGKYGAIGVSVLCFVCSPKSIFIPEYSNLHILFFALFCLALMWYYCALSPQKGKMWVLVAAGFCLTCDVLSYPSIVIVLPFCLIIMAYKRVNAFWKEVMCFVGPCLVSAGVFFAYILSYMSLEQLMKVIPHVLGDGSHQVGIVQKVMDNLQDMGGMCVQLGICAVVAWIMTCLYLRIQKKKALHCDWLCTFLMFFFGVHIVFMLCTWFTLKYNAGYTRIIYIGIALAGIYCYIKTGKKEKTGFYLILLSFVNYCAVILLSNWKPSLLACYLVMGAVGGLLCWELYFRERGVKVYRGLLYSLGAILAICCCFGYCFRIIGGRTILEIRGINHDGFRKGILTDYMTAYRFNTNQEMWDEIVPAGSRVMYVGMSQFSYMHGNCIVAVPSTISTPTYNETLLAYWEMNPDRYPDVVILESCYGDIGEAEQDEFLLKWLEQDFKAKEITDYPYMRVYKK